ncbi:MAG: LysR family transcriptional regulator [Dehalococcoidia bacterium]|nr:MAG: LysR family transcriptional regulator [Dehalococcoidia bacterium]
MQPVEVAMPDSEARNPLRLRVKIWLERGDEVVLSEYRARLLEAIAQYGSVAAASTALRLPIRTAWKKLREMEAAAGIPLLESGSGGSGGGSSTLTPEARAMVEAFRRIARPTTTAAEQGFADERRRFPR